jgi:hypothetical protein
MLFGLLGPSAVASEWDKKTVVTFDNPVEIPGVVLVPGTYVFNLENTWSDRHVVQVWDSNDRHLIATIMTVPVNREEPAEQSIFTFKELRADSPLALDSWFFPGDTTGQKFEYPQPKQNSHSTTPRDLR